MPESQSVDETQPADEFVITVGSDAHGLVFEVDASRWSHDAMTEAIRHQLMRVASPTSSAASSATPSATPPAAPPQRAPMQPVSVWIDHPDRCAGASDQDQPNVFPSVADRLTKRLGEIGLKFQRDIYRMERPLPMPERTDIETRAFQVGVDDETWITVNNRAFRGHREQGGWTKEMLVERMAEPWFDPEGFRVHDIDGEMAAFCWTKIHTEGADTESAGTGLAGTGLAGTGPANAVGEVYVIAVNPDFQGRGLGRALTLAGYQHLESVGITRAMLYVDADNTPALTLYKELGLEITVVRRLYTDQ